MSEKEKHNTGLRRLGPGEKLINPGLPGSIERDPSFTVGDNFIVLGKDGEYGPGKVGIKYGDTGKDWIRWSYIDMKKFVNFLIQNKDLFNDQLSKEKEALGLIGEL